jgi:hypothetical protein
MEFFQSPEFLIPVGILFVILFIWANRCKKCGKWFAYSLKSRRLIHQGYVQRWVQEKGSSTRRLKKVYEYKYDCTYICVNCFDTYSTTQTTSYPRACGSFAVKFKDGSVQEEDLGEVSQGCLSKLFTAFKYGLKFLAIAFVIALIGLPVYDSDIIFHPRQIFVERYVEFLIEPWGNHPRKTELEVVGASWKLYKTIQEYDGNKWKSIKTEVLEGEGQIDVAKLSSFKPVEGEAAPGQKRSKFWNNKLRIHFKEPSSGKVYKVDMLCFREVKSWDFSVETVGPEILNYMLSKKGKKFKVRLTDSIYPSVTIFADLKLFNEGRQKQRLDESYKY